jgi:hypothetical protein
MDDQQQFASDMFGCLGIAFVMCVLFLVWALH